MRKPLSNLKFAGRVLLLLFKGFAVLFLALGIGIGALILALPRIVDGERARAFLVARLETVLHRKVEIDGVILSPQGIKLRGLRVAARPPLEGRMIEAESALITVKLPALLRKRLELGTVKLVGPKIRVFRDENGAWSFADIFTSSGPAREEPIGSFSLPLSLAAETSTIEGGSLELLDFKGRGSYNVERFNLSVERFSIDSPFVVALSFDNRNEIGKRQVNVSAEFSGLVDLKSLDWSLAELSAQKIAIKVDGQPVRGKAHSIGIPPRTLQFDLELPPLGPEQWKAYVGTAAAFHLPKSRWQAKFVTPEPGKIAVEGFSAEAGALALTATGAISLSTPTAPAVDLHVQAAPFPLDQTGQYRPSLADHELKGTAQAHAKVSGWFGKFRLREAHLRLRGVHGLLKKQRVRNLDLDLTGYDDFARLAISLSRGNIAAFGQTFSDIALAMSLNRRDLKVDFLSARWADSKLRVKGRVVDLADPKEVMISGSLDKLEWERAQNMVESILQSTRTASTAELDEDDPRRLWVRTFKYAIPRRFPDTVGQVSIGQVTHKNFSFNNLDLSWDLRGVSPGLEIVSGELEAGFGPGRVVDIQAVQDSHKFLKIVFLPYIYMHKMNSLSVLSAATAYPKTLDFNRIEGQYGVEAGVVRNRFFIVDSPQVYAYADGTADFNRERVDMSILTRLTGYRAPLPEWWVDELGRPAIGFRVTGDLNRPDLEPRLRKMQGDEIERALVSGRSRAKESLAAVERLKKQLGEPFKPE